MANLIDTKIKSKKNNIPLMIKIQHYICKF